MGLFDGLQQRLGNGRLDTERAWLTGLRESCEQWYNEMTEPLLPILRSGELDFPEPTLKDFHKATSELYEQWILVNAGNHFANLKVEMGNRGMPFSGRDELRDKIVSYVHAGKFLRKSVTDGFSSPYITSGDIRQVISEARSQWKEFRDAKDSVVDQINTQLGRLG